MKRYGHLWQKLIGFPNLLAASELARRGKRKRADVAQFHFKLESNLWSLHDELREKRYRPSPYYSFEIFDPKHRIISAAPYRDRVVHHAVCRILEPIFEPTFVFDSYACRKGKGTHAALDRTTRFMQTNRYVLKCDVWKFFPSIKHQILKNVVARKIKDPQVLGLVDRIIDAPIRQHVGDFPFPTNNFNIGETNRHGLPIGNQTSQFFANVYMNPWDHFVKEVLRCKSYVRYCDDFLVFSNDKSWLAEVREHCYAFLSSLELLLHPRKREISPVIDGVRFLGFRVFPDHRRIVPENVVRMRRRLRRLQSDYAQGSVTLPEISQRLSSWIGHAQHANTWRLREGLFREITFVRNPN